MPAFDYKCPKGHITEHFMKEFQEEIRCDFIPCGQGGRGCSQSAKYHPSFYYNSRSAQRFTPVVIHRDVNGNVRYPGHVNAPVPKGFQKVELTDFYQVRKFEKEMNDRDRVQAQEFSNTRQKFLDGQLAENRRVVDSIVKGATWQGVDQDGRPVTRQGMSPHGRKFLESMRQVSLAKQQSSRHTPDPAFYIEAFSQDSSNRVEYQDALNDWGRSGQRK